jgi:hypothetical protein
MQRRKAITAAAAISLTLVAGATGIALSSGIVGSQTNDGVGQLSPIALTTQPAVATVHEPTTTTAAAAVSAPAVRATDSTPTTTSTASAHVSDDELEADHEEYEDGDHDDDHEEYEDGDHEYEGAEDDD